MGSENGIPISIMSTPDSSSFLAINGVLFNEGNPAVKNTDRIFFFLARKSLSILFILILNSKFTILNSQLLVSSSSQLLILPPPDIRFQILVPSSGKIDHHNII